MILLFLSAWRKTGSQLFFFFLAFLAQHLHICGVAFSGIIDDRKSLYWWAAPRRRRVEQEPFLTLLLFTLYAALHIHIQYDRNGLAKDMGDRDI